ncbi:MAG: hypothetical protein JWP75_483 [Frondihabitans sp.]|nr:hypothetical protein [Frondihabitans sp.]
MRAKSKQAAVTPETVDPAVVQVATADGLLIARAAATVSVANRIIVHALRDQAAFDRDETRVAVVEEITHLADEQANLASRMVETRGKALKSRGRSRHQFDYRPDDNEALALRQTISATVSTELRALRDDSSYVDNIVLAARDRAWNDIGSAIMSQVNSIVVPDRDYSEKRDDRIRQLLDVDLAALLAEAPSTP